jgi:hypothetical protein
VRRLTATFALTSLAAVVASAMPACSLGTGQGQITGVLNVPDCWSGPFNMTPDFFGAVPYRSTLELRIQSGGDYETFSDGVQILIDDITKIRPSPGNAGLYDTPLDVSLPVGVTPPGVPITPDENPANVHLALYLTGSCRTQNPALYAMRSVTLNAAGGCDKLNGGDPVLTCAGSSLGLADAGTPEAGALDGGASSPDATVPVDAGASGDGGVGAVASGGVGHSTISFHSLFDGDPTEVSADQRLNEGTFDVYLADPREICPGGLGPPPPCRGSLHGYFKFYFERGRPAQPFP